MGEGLSRWLLAALVAALIVFGAASAARAAARVPVEYGIDRSNMSTQWTLAFRQEPNVSPCLSAEYNKPGNFEARRVAVRVMCQKSG